MIEGIRRALIEDGLISAVQFGTISNRDRGRVLEYLRLNNWKLSPQLGVSNALWLEVIRACPMLGAESSTPITTTTPTKGRQAAEEISYGFTRES